MIVIGLGSGRSGTASLAHLLNHPNNALVFHQLNPGRVNYNSAFAPIRNTIKELEIVLDGGDFTEITMDLSIATNQRFMQTLLSIRKDTEAR